MFENDRPITDKQQDRLNRYEFSAALAKTISDLSTDEVFTIGLYGKWGSGKTSIINMALQELLAISESLPDEEKPVIMQFNPWNYSNSDQLLQQFFSCLSSALNVSIKGSKISKIGKIIKEYSDALSSASWLPVIGKYVDAIQLLGNLSGETMQQITKGDLNIAEIKEKLSAALKKQTRKIIIIIDDIDRLSNEEIKMIFQLVSAVASFPNVVYLLSFDYDVVTRALKEVQNCEDGGEYLEKIIQVPFEIPAASKKYINQIFYDKLGSIISQVDYAEDNSDKEHWGNVFWNIINPDINSIRSVKRLLNTFQLKQNLMNSELNWCDLLAITSLQVFHMPIFQWIKNNKELVLDTAYQYKGITRNEQIECEEKFRTQFELVAPKRSQYMLDCITTLFPQFAHFVGASSESFDSNLFRRTGRIASKENFDYFFNLSLSDIPIKSETLNKILYSANRTEIETFIKSFIANENYIEFLTRLQGTETVLSQERLITLIPPLMLSLGYDTEESTSGMWSWSSNDLIQNIVRKFLLALTQEKRGNLWREIIREMSIENLPYMAEFINREELAHGRLAGDESEPEKQLVQLDVLLEIESDFTQRISEIVKDKSLLDIPFMMPLYLWESFDPNGCQEYISNELKESKINKCRFVAGNAHEWKGLAPRRRIGWNYEPSCFEKYITAEEAQKVVEDCIQDGTIYSLPEETQEKLAAFLLFQSDSVKEKDKISQEKAQRLVSMWKKHEPLESVNWDMIQ